jgi:hypothetical protein
MKVTAERRWSHLRSVTVIVVLVGGVPAITVIHEAVGL